MEYFEKYFYNLNIAFEAVIANKFRSMLTALGIIFGVAAVIAMLAIGNGARQEILEQMKMVGVNNIIIRPLFAKDESQDESQRGKFSPGLTLADVESIREVVPTVKKLSPEVEISTFAMNEGIRRPVRVGGVTPDYFEVYRLKIAQGEMFSEAHLKEGAPVAIIGNNIRGIFFGSSNPIGKQIKAGSNWLTVIGVVEDRLVTEDAIENLGVSEFNNVIYTPVQTLLLRFQDRSAISVAELQQSRRGGGRGRGNFVVIGGVAASSEEDQAKNYHQLDRITVQVENSEQLTPSADVIQRMLIRRHYGVEDFEVIVPELLLEQEQRTKDIFNIVLGAIAGISLIVGGIGIMNIMLASVMERTREIGIRLAVGARKSDVVFQFLSESTIISVSGGILGIFLGIGLSRAIMHFTDILTIVSPESILVSFGVAATVGIVFGYMPARKAAEKDPVTSLRYE
ncbi:MAG: ABC transporter permease [Bacteroides sp.]|jgi:putative ABC transport system permease protein|nr:ABC transporter permease [Bacteroides sp.]